LLQGSGVHAQIEGKLSHAVLLEPHWILRLAGQGAAIRCHGGAIKTTGGQS
jgi:hypothetical protein